MKKLTFRPVNAVKSVAVLAVPIETLVDAYLSRSCSGRYESGSGAMYQLAYDGQTSCLFTLSLE
jgi:hypothetical protein